MHRMAMATSDSAWHHQLSNMTEKQDKTQTVYWLHPFKTYKTFCPYLVGSYEDVASALHSYATLGVTGLILDVPATENDLHSTAEVINMVRKSISQNPVTQP